ncbi:MAG: tetratricopeptide (TPR) repeat protein, partial [Myxococcota bacterium]
MKKHNPWSAILLPLLLSAPALAAPPALPPVTSQHADTPEPITDGVRLLRSGRAQSASVAFADLLREGRYPAETTQLHYYLARSLADLDLLHTAQHHYLKVISAGPDDPYFSYALARLIDISQITGDETTLRRVAAKLDAEDFPRGARSALSHLKAVERYSKGDTTSAKRLLADVEASSPRYDQARYLEGVILNQEGRSRAAVRAFKEVAQLEDADAQLHDLAIL